MPESYEGYRVNEFILLLVGNLLSLIHASHEKDPLRARSRHDLPWDDSCRTDFLARRSQRCGV